MSVIAANPLSLKVARNQGVHRLGLRVAVGRGTGSAIGLLGKVRRSVEQRSVTLAVLSLLADPAEIFLRAAL